MDAIFRNKVETEIIDITDIKGTTVKSVENSDGSLIPCCLNVRVISHILIFRPKYY
jgi:hypothetical protein